MPTATVDAASERTLRAIGALGGAALVLLLVVPRTSPAVMVLLVLIAAVTAGISPGWARLTRLTLPAALTLALAAWGLISVAWAADRGEAIGKSTMLAAFTLAVVWTQHALREAQPELLRQAARVSLIAFAAGLAYLCVEEITGHALKRALFTVLPFTRPSTKHMSEFDGDIAVNGYIANRNMAAAILVLWPMLLMARSLIDEGRRLPAIAALILLTGVALSLSQHETSLIALILSSLVFAICIYWPKLGLAAVAAGWLVATLLVVPIVGWASRGATLHEASWLPHSARHRIVLWAYAAEQIPYRPFTGVGAASTKSIDAARGSQVDVVPGTKFQWRSGPHAHNVYLQTWYELGAVGAALLCAAGLGMIAVLSRLPRGALPFGAAAMTSAAVTAAFSYGMWQPWFMALFAVSAALSALAVRLFRHDEPAGSQHAAK